jgi:hypothetical protein
MRTPIYFLLLVVLGLQMSARYWLGPDELRMLQDSGGWQYIKMSDPDNGIQTTHTCFDGRPHPEQCSGTLTLAPDKTFMQSVRIHGQTVRRHGTYQVDDRQLAFFDEFGTRDGPYSLDINMQKKILILEMPQIRIELELKSEYRKHLEAAKQQPK